MYVDGFALPVAKFNAERMAGGSFNGVIEG